MGEREAETPRTGFFHVAKNNLHGRSAREVDPPFESFDVVLRRDWDVLLARVASLEGALRKHGEHMSGFEAALAVPSEDAATEDGFVYSEEPGPQAGALCFDPTHKTPSVDATAEANASADEVMTDEEWNRRYEMKRAAIAEADALPPAQEAREALVQGLGDLATGILTLHDTLAAALTDALAREAALRADRDAQAKTLGEVWERIAAGDSDGAVVLIEAALAVPSEDATPPELAATPTSSGAAGEGNEPGSGGVASSDACDCEAPRCQRDGCQDKPTLPASGQDRETTT